MKTIMRLAAAFLVCASVLVFLMVSGTPRVAFAQAITALKEIKTVQAHSIATVVMPGGNGQQAMDGELVIVAPNKLRMSTTSDVGNGQPPDVQVQIWDYGTGQNLSLLQNSKIAILRTQTDIPEKERPISIIQQLINADAKDAKPAGEKEIAGKKAQGFVLADNEKTMTVWIDPATRLPIEVEVTPKIEQMPGARTTIVFSDFVWNEPVDPSLVSLDAPAGYQLQKSNPTPYRLSEQDVINTLKEVSDFLNGRYPDQFDIYGLSYDLGTRTGLAFGQPDEQKLRARAAQIQGNANRVWQFMTSPEYGSGFHYAGKGKKAGTKEPIFWYRPAGSQKYRLIDASLNVTEVPADQLPKVKSQSLPPAPAPAPAAQ